MCEKTISCTFVPGFHDEARVKKMNYNYLGQTGFKVSEFSLGTSAFSNLHGYSYDKNECIATLREAVRSGINYIDTSPYYGHAEKIVGKALQNIPRKSYYIATRVGRYQNADPSKIYDYSSHKTIESVEHSLKKLGLDYVDIIQVSNIEFAPSLDVIINECLPALKKLIKAGKAKYIGITGYPVSVLKDCIDRSNVRISTVLSSSRMTLIDDTLNSYLPFFNDKRVGVINSAATAMDLLTNRGNCSTWHPACDEMKEMCRKARIMCISQNVQMRNLALHHTFSNKTVPTHLLKMNTVQELKESLNIYYNGLKCVEKDCLHNVRRFFSKLTEDQRHWEGVELAQYLESIGM